MAKSVYNELHDLAYGWISYMNREAVIAYSEKQLAAYKAGIEKTPFTDIATGMVTQAVTGGESSQKTRDILGGYLGYGQALNNKIVEESIIGAIENYLHAGSQAISEAVKKGDYLHCDDVPYQAGKSFMVTGKDHDGRFILIDLEVLSRQGENNLDFTDLWLVSPQYLEQHFSVAK